MELLTRLEAAKIGTRLMFAGNLIRQPAMAGHTFRVSGSLDQADRIMNQTFWVGVYPGLGTAELDHVAATIRAMIRTKGHKSQSA